MCRPFITTTEGCARIARPRVKSFNRNSMKKFLLLASFLVLASGLYPADKEIKLVKPDMNKPATVMKALSERKSTREYADRELSNADLSGLLWAANGINRPSEGKRTAPSAMNRQEVDVYVVLPQGVYLYDAKTHKLTLVAEGDHRAAVAGGQDFVNKAPLSLVLVADLSKMGDPKNERVQNMCAVDVGIVSQNISIYCAAAGLATVPRGTMDATKLSQVMKLKESQKALINHPVGYFK